ncbi:hypothetical protein GCM10025858_06410 [Alicyclobacillus sacchari]|nr:hypothetical protein [Alicyclobacillus sacchari]GMA56138.1 hypothetical protein GCM10025858_06410 [Alicyclobacillus sacchari]
MVFSGWGQAIRQFLDDEKFRQNHRIRTWIYIGLGLAMFAILVGSILPPRYHFTVGQTSPTTIVSPTTTVDTAATEAEKEAAESKVPKQYAQSPAVLTQAVNRVDILFAAAMQAVSDSSLSDADKLKQLRNAAPAGVSQATLVRLLTHTPQR